MENKLTAVDWLFKDQDLDDFDTLMLYKIAKGKEKEQIMDAWKNGFMSSSEGWNGEIPPECYGEKLDIEQYYNELYEN